jgi:hypothetical protein
VHIKPHKRRRVKNRPLPSCRRALFQQPPGVRSTAAHHPRSCRCSTAPGPWRATSPLPWQGQQRRQRGRGPCWQACCARQPTVHAGARPGAPRHSAKALAPTPKYPGAQRPTFGAPLEAQVGGAMPRTCAFPWRALPASGSPLGGGVAVAGGLLKIDATEAW